MVRFVSLLGMLLLVSPHSAWGADPAAFRCGEELLVRIPRLDVLRLQNPQLTAVVRITGKSSEKQFTVDLSDPAVPETLVFDTTGFGLCTAATIDITNGRGKSIDSRKMSPVPSVTVQSGAIQRSGQLAAIEPGSGWKPTGHALPRIEQPDGSKLRQEVLGSPGRTVTAKKITYPVVTDSDLPVPASENYVLVSRQSAAADDPSRCSLYFSYRKAVFDNETMQFKKWRKLLVEVPLDRAWIGRTGDEVLTLAQQKFAVHATEEMGPRGANMLGESPTGLAQGGQSADVDEQGRIYFSNVSGGAGLVRFNPHTQRFEQPPVDFISESQKQIPPDGDWVRTWDADLGNLVCTRGRVYIVFGRNYRVRTPNGNFETCSGVISIPQERWDNAIAFMADIRLHAGAWPDAKYPLYEASPAPAQYLRNLVAPVATRHGLFFSSAADAKGGPWRLDLDDKGNTLALAVVKSLQAPAAVNGKALPPTDAVLSQGLPRQRMINIGSAGRQFVKIGYGEFEISRAALALTLPGATVEQLVDANGRHRSTFDGAPQGTLTVRFDVAGYLKANRSRFGEVAQSLAGLSLGPNYCVTPIPGEADQAIAVCEYGYFLSKLDFSRRDRERKVIKEYLPYLSNGEVTSLPARAGLGPYNTAWAKHDGAEWLYLTGYTGISRIKYSVDGVVQKAFAAEMIHGQLQPQAADGRNRDNVKDYLHIVPVFGGRLINIGRGRPGRGGGAYSAGLELFDPSTLGKSQTLVAMSRCYGLYTPVSRMVFSTSGAPPRQEFFVASGGIRPEYLEDITDAAERPVNRDPKIFHYDCDKLGPLRDRFGFSTPPRPDGDDSSGSIALSPCRQFLVLLQHGGRVYSYHLKTRAWIDGVQLQAPAGQTLQMLGFDGPSEDLWTAPSGQLFFHAHVDAAKSKDVTFYELTVSQQGRIGIRPHLAVSCETDGKPTDLAGIVRCFLPDLKNKDGSYDFVLGGNQGTGPPSVRVIDDFIAASPLE